VNGDIRLNIRMLGVLAGIVFIGAIGSFLMRSMRKSVARARGRCFAVGSRSSSSASVGLLFARLIEARVAPARVPGR